jgi:hypothetical protein
MKTAQIIAATVLIVASALALHVAQAQQAGTKRTDLGAFRGVVVNGYARFFPYASRCD